jgi:hypothetical protein
MSVHKADIRVRDQDRINIDHEWELCVWARYFNASEKHVKEAVAAVGDRALKVKEHLEARAGSGGARAHSERPGS